ncbi:MAG: flagellar motor switch protein FliN [Planctomycetota bacterium]
MPEDPSDIPNETPSGAEGDAAPESTPAEPSPEPAGGADAADDQAEALEAAREAVQDIQAEADAAASSGATPESAEPGGKEAIGQSEIDALLAAAGQQQPGGEGLELPSFERSASGGDAGGIDMLADVQLSVRIELGRTRMLVEDVLKLNDGAVVELDKLAGDPVDVYVNDRLVARGEVLVLNDNFCVRVSEIVDHIGEEAAAEKA